MRHVMNVTDKSSVTGRSTSRATNDANVARRSELHAVHTIAVSCLIDRSPSLYVAIRVLSAVASGGLTITATHLE